MKRSKTIELLSSSICEEEATFIYSEGIFENFSSSFFFLCFFTIKAIKTTFVDFSLYLLVV